MNTDQRADLDQPQRLVLFDASAEPANGPMHSQASDILWLEDLVGDPVYFVLQDGTPRSSGASAQLS